VFFIFVVSVAALLVHAAKQLLNRAVLLVGAHGAGFAHMLFMPAGGWCLSFGRTSTLPSAVRHMARASGHTFKVPSYMPRVVHGKDAASTSLRLDVSDVKDELTKLKDIVMEEWLSYSPESPCILSFFCCFWPAEAFVHCNI